MNTKNMNNWERRRFLSLGARTVAGAGLSLGAHPLLGMARGSTGPLNDGDEYRALVCVFLEGGMDGFSLFVPSTTAEYSAYRRSRGGLSVDSGNLLSLGSSSPFGLHQSAAALQSLYSDERLAIMSNVGNLVEPTTRSQYTERAVEIPSQLFSHADQMVQWQQLQGRGRSREGWGALAADHLAERQTRDHLTSISVAGSNHWQTSAGQRPFTLRETGLVNYSGLNAANVNQQPRANAFDALMQAPSQSILQQGYSELQQRARNNTAEIGAVLSSRFRSSSDDPVPHNPEGNKLAARLNMVAKLIAVHQELGMNRQIFYVRLGGFDVHDDQNNRMPGLFANLANALTGFQSAIDNLGLDRNVTTFTASDFGRSLNSNGDGTDHGWGNHLFAMGGAVNGGQVYGDVPLLDVNGPDSVHNGRILPTTAATQYAATMLSWLGLNDAELNDVLPTLSRFGSSDLGFLG